MSIKDIQEKYEFDVYQKRDIVLVKGKGAKVWDENGKQYIDCAAGHGVALVGHCNDRVIEAIKNQSRKLITCPGIIYTEQRALFLEKLMSIVPNNLKKAFLCNSGTESIEAALKFARFSTKRTDFICMMRSFHGRTFAAMSATFNPKYKQDFEPLVPGFHFVPFNNFEKLRAAVTDKTAAVLLEPIQGEGGINIAEKTFLQNVRELCDEQDIVLIFDEVQCGLCRTGEMFGCDHFDIQPDILCLAKGLAGGVPLGAVVCSDKIDVPIGRHGSTFGGNPLSCAAGIAAIDFMLEEDLAGQAKEKGEYFEERFSKHDLAKVREVRVKGLMIGIELKVRSKPYLEALAEKGVLALPAGPTVIRLLPPLVITREELDSVIESFVEVLKQ